MKPTNEPGIAWPPGVHETLPDDADDALLVGRIERPGLGPSVVTVRGDLLVDITRTFPTMRDLGEHPDPAAAVRAAPGETVGLLADVLAATPPEHSSKERPRLLSPIDLQAVKAAGVTFAISMLERVIEERAHGDPAAAEQIREQIVAALGDDLRSVVPGSAEAGRVKELLVAEGLWSQYLEVGLGPDAEIFTKTGPMASVGTATDVGVHPGSSWNNPEPEVAVLVSSTARIVGATLGNDVNLRDFEGRSALLLSKAKDNNASASVGPFIRLFDERFNLDDVRTSEVALHVTGADGFTMRGSSSMDQISRDPSDLVEQLIGPHHQYPDGAVLYLGTMFAPVEDRDATGGGFTHHVEDLVRISTPRLGGLVNRVRTSDQCEPWTYGIGALFRSLAARGLPDHHS